MRNNIRIFYIFLWLMSTAGIFLVPLAAFGEAPAFVFDEGNRYDIYFSYGVVKGVNILGTKMVQGSTFLIIALSNLKNQDTQGYILLSAVTAILPSGYITANPLGGSAPYPSYNTR